MQEKSRGISQESVKKIARNKTKSMLKSNEEVEKEYARKVARN